MVIRDQILAKLKASGLTKYALAKRLAGQVKSRTLYDYLSGRSQTNTRVLEAILDAMHMRVSDVFDYSTSPQLALKDRWIAWEVEQSKAKAADAKSDQ